MNYFTSAPLTLTPEEKKSPQNQTGLIVRKPTKQQKQELYKGLTHAVEGMYTKHMSSSGNLARRGENLTFPTPQQASKLNKIYNIIQTEDLGIVTSAATPVNGAINFAYSQLTQQASLTAIFDQYRLAMVEVTFQPEISITAPSQAPPLLFTVVDLDDSATITTAQYKEYPGCQETMAIRRHKHTFVPHIAVAAYSGAFTSFKNEPAPWIDVASPAVQHYGVKYGFSAEPSAATAFGYAIKVRYHFQFRNVR